jgi:hypothetical protein
MMRASASHRRTAATRGRAAPDRRTLAGWRGVADGAAQRHGGHGRVEAVREGVMPRCIAEPLRPRAGSGCRNRLALSVPA